MTKIEVIPYRGFKEKIKLIKELGLVEIFPLDLGNCLMYYLD